MDEEISIIDTKTRNEKIKNFLVQNKKLIILSITVSIMLLREQLYVNDEQWLKRMISHHSTALTTSHNIYNKTNNANLKKLAKDIIDKQEKEIKIMK